MTALDYIDETHPIEVRQLLISAHRFLRESLPPFSVCSIKWKIPFYTLHRNLCYLNRHRDHITIGFVQGYRLSPRPKILLGESEKLKQIRYLEIFSIEDLYSENTQQILNEAIILDELLAAKRLKKYNAKKETRD